MHTKTWHVDIHLSDHGDGRVGAEAVLHTDSGTEVRHRADAHLGTIGEEVPEIAEELAACRALSTTFNATLICASPVRSATSSIACRCRSRLRKSIRG